MIATTSYIGFATSTMLVSEASVLWLSTAIVNGIILGLFIGILSRATWWVWK